MKKTVIYLRTSTEEQNPENQLRDCETLAKKLNLFDYEVLQDKVSAWKDVEREGFEKIKKAIMERETITLICWDLDRLFRNRKKLIAFFELCKFYECKIHSFRQEWLESINEIRPPFNEIMHKLMLQIMGWLAEEESRKKSERVRLTIKKVNGKTFSKFGKKWGRKSLNINKRVIENIKKLKAQGLSFSQIAKQVYYYDKNNNKKKMSASIVYKLYKANQE